MNLLQLRDLSRKKMGETTAAFWTDDEVNLFINEACRSIAHYTKCIRRNAYISTSDCTQNTVSAKTNEITLTIIDSLIDAPYEVYFLSNGINWIKLDLTTRSELDQEYTGWRDSVGYTYTDPSSGAITYNKSARPAQPLFYYFDTEENLFGWYPPTDTDNTLTSNLRVYYTKRPVTVSADADVPELPEQLHLCITDFACSMAFETRGIIDRANDYWRKTHERMLMYIAERGREREDEEILMRPR